jgi:hypothetical protein
VEILCERVMANINFQIRNKNLLITHRSIFVYALTINIRCQDFLNTLKPF